MSGVTIPRFLACAALFAVACGGAGHHAAAGSGGASALGGDGANAGAGANPQAGGRANANAGATAAAGTRAAGTGAGTGASNANGSGGSGVMRAPPPPLADIPTVSGKCSAGTDTLNFETAEFCVRLAKNSQTIVGLQPKAAAGFDYAPADLVATRSGAGYFYLGDLTLRVRSGSSGEWQNVTTAASRAQVSAMPAMDKVLAAADLTAALPSSLPLTITRSYLNLGGRLVMRFELKNKSSSPVQVGALGLPMVFNNVLTNRTLDQAHATCSFADPYIGRDAGYLQVTRLNGQGPALLVLPDGTTPFEAYNPILNQPKAGSKDPVALFTDPTPRGTSFEGFLEWMVHSKAYADKEWMSATPWNQATDLMLAPGETKTYGVQFVLSDTIRHIEQTLVANQRPVAVGIPGYVLPTDLEGKLYIDYPWDVSSIEVEPAGALELTPQATTASGWLAYGVAAKTFGRARVSVNYTNGVVQTIQYYVTKPAQQTVTDLGNFLTTKAWFVDANDPFGRSPSVMTYDHELSQIVTQHKQSWICGLGDDGGATWLAGAMKLFAQPEAAQAGKYQQFVDGVVWGNLQYKDGAQQYGIKRTLFYYDPNAMPGYYSSSVEWIDPATGMLNHGAWDHAYTLQTGRSYNYPHVAALYWSMYRLARDYQGLVSNHPWDWYLNQAYETIVGMTTVGADYSKFGLMDGSVFLEILNDLQREGLSDKASDLEQRMRSREGLWKTEAYPFGSEMPWDSTGQEEVYAWTRHFGDTDKAKVCVDAVTAYMPAIPHWGYNGCARRYWDFVYGGAKIDRIERMIHHYGSSLNSSVVLGDFRDHPTDYHLLRIGYAGMMGSLSNIDQDGFPSMAFHAFPDTLKWDPITGDYGLNFFGHAQNAATYLVNHPDFGWQAFGGNVSVSGDKITVTVLDSLRRRLYVAPIGLWLTLDAGQFQTLEFDNASKSVTLTLAPADANTTAARLRIEQPGAAAQAPKYTPAGTPALERGAYVVALTSAPTSVALAAH